MNRHERRKRGIKEPPKPSVLVNPAKPKADLNLRKLRASVDHRWIDQTRVISRGARRDVKPPRDPKDTAGHSVKAATDVMDYARLFVRRSGVCKTPEDREAVLAAGRAMKAGPI